MFGIVATMFVDVKLVTDNGVLFRTTVGVVAPKFAPVSVIFCVTKLTTALVTTGWFVDTAWTLTVATVITDARSASTTTVFDFEFISLEAGF